MAPLHHHQGMLTNDNVILVGLFHIIWFGIYYEYRGYKKKARQCLARAGFGLIFWFVVGILAALAG